MPANLEYIEDQRRNEHAVEFETLIAENVKQTAATAVLRQHGHVPRVDTCSDERIQIIMTNFANLSRQ